jgi:hypothetical protein
MHKKKFYFNKTFVIGIIILLIGMNVTPIINGSIKLKNKIPNYIIIKEIANVYSQPCKIYKNGFERYPKSFGSYPESCSFVWFYHPPRELEWKYNNEDFNGTIKEFRLLASDNTNHQWDLSRFELHINSVNCSTPDTQTFYRKYGAHYQWEIIWESLNLNCSGEILFEILYLDCTWIEYKGDYDSDGDETFHYSYYSPRSFINGELDGDYIFDSDKAYIVWYTPTNYSPPDPPSKPTGNTSGYICIDHNYSTSTIDPKGLNVSYGWDWNSDQEVDEWTDCYNSNETCVISHNWSNPNKYRISVKAINTNGEESNWSSRLNVTIKNHPPYAPSDPSPPNSQPDVPVNVKLCWTGGDPDICDTVTYDVYFGLYDPPTQQIYSGNETCCDPYGEDDLQLFETYYWKVIAWDNHGAHNSSKTWTFNTGINPPPTDPDFDIPSRWPVGEELCINFSSTDPDNNSILYIIDWGNGTIDETNFFPSGELVEMCHTYETKGFYTIRIRAMDEYGAWSDWSEFIIEIPRGRLSANSFFSWIIKRYLLFEILFSLD